MSEHPFSCWGEDGRGWQATRVQALQSVPGKGMKIGFKYYSLDSSSPFMCRLLYREGNSVPDIQILMKLLSTITTQLNGYSICYSMKTFSIKSAELQFYTLYAQTQIWPGFDAYTITVYLELSSPQYLYNTFVFSCSG